jgi:choline dehydrogenase-like flavoprotein
MDGCEVGAIATSVNAILPDAIATGRLTLRTNALVRQIDVDEEGRASGVTFVDRVTRREHSVRARFVALGCGAIETPRLLLNSSSARFPNGLANSSELVGRYLTGHTQLNMHGYLEALIGRDPVNQDGATDHSIIPRYNHLRPAQQHVGGFFAQVSRAARPTRTAFPLRPWNSRTARTTGRSGTRCPRRSKRSFTSPGLGCSSRRRG